jgi:hypothetical protein
MCVSWELADLIVGAPVRNPWHYSTSASRFRAQFSELKASEHEDDCARTTVGMQYNTSYRIPAGEVTGNDGTGRIPKSCCKKLGKAARMTMLKNNPMSA